MAGIWFNQWHLRDMVISTAYEDPQIGSGLSVYVFPKLLSTSLNAKITLRREKLKNSKKKFFKWNILRKIQSRFCLGCSLILGFVFLLFSSNSGITKIWTETNRPFDSYIWQVEFCIPYSIPALVSSHFWVICHIVLFLSDFCMKW